MSRLASHLTARAAGVLVVVALASVRPGAASVAFNQPASDPAAPTSGQPVSARLVLYPLCSLAEEVDVAVVRTGDVIELRYIEPICDSVTPPGKPFTVALGPLDTGTYTLRLIEVSDPWHPHVAEETTLVVAASPCGADALCLQGGRFAVSAEWRTKEGATGTAHPVAFNEETGAFWFFTPGNYEVEVKVLDACAINNRFWFYAAGLTDVEVMLHVADISVSGSYHRTYTTPLGKPFAPISDTQSFQCTCENCSR